jgi:glycosyltransferase involved in cell wall biosynthesis
MKPSISVLIRTFNSAKTLDGVLAQLNLSDGDECIVVDSGSEDSTLEIAARHKARTIKVNPPFHYSRSLNEGFAVAHGDWVLVLSSHCIPLRPDLLVRMRQIAATAADDIAVIYGRVALYDPGVIHPQIESGNLNDWKAGRFIAGGNGFAMYPKKYWSLRQFNEEIVTAEDLDWLVWSLKSGFRASVVEDAVVIYRNQGNMAYMFRKGWNEGFLNISISEKSSASNPIRKALISLVINSLYHSKLLIWGKISWGVYKRVLAHGIGANLAGLTLSFGYMPNSLKRLFL